MQFYPHNAPLAVDQATSASLAKQATFLNNFINRSITIATASVGLNITGSVGTSGSNYVKVGATGPTGPQGLKGYRGKNVYLLSASWNQGTCTQCYEYIFGSSSVELPNYYRCFFGLETKYYSTDSTLVSGVSPMYYDVGCTSLATNITAAHSQNGDFVVQTNGSGIYSQFVGCDSSE